MLKGKESKEASLGAHTMKPDVFLEQLRLLTGRPVHPSPLPDSDLNFLAEALDDDNKLIDYSQFNELLLMANKDRVEAPFFNRFFCSPNPGLCAVKSITDGVEKFQKMAMLRFGNFIYAYRTLSKVKSEPELTRMLDEKLAPADLEAGFERRRNRIIDIQNIDREDTYLVGYLSAGQVREDYKMAAGLLKLLQGESSTNWEELERDLEDMGKAVQESGEKTTLVEQGKRLIGKYRMNTDLSLQDFEQQIIRDLKSLTVLHEKLESTLERATRNTDVYLTWDHMDVYFATSMRRSWEFEDLYDFVHMLMETKEISGKRKTLTDLNVRYFDPTQSFDQNRVNKGLIESLMLKRAVCTVYSVQDTDTLGKDSELAATLAQGKPVIAFAPEINVEIRIKELSKRRPAALKQRLQWIVYEGALAEDPKFIDEFVAKLDRFEEKMFWDSLTDATLLKQFQADNAADLERFCRSLASSEKHIYDKRFKTLKSSHPLGIQVNLDTGVANGVLVVRDIQTCADLLWRIVTNALEFTTPYYDSDAKCWYLKEALTESIYRVVTANEKLTNCFWNFYQPNE
jgi:hypothetical protein